MAIGDKKRVLMEEDIGTNGGVAPAGFGLGGRSASSGVKELTAADNLNEHTANGWYQWGDKPQNAPLDYAVMFVMSGMGTYTVQKIYSYNHQGCFMQRYTFDGGATWVEEWENPPMQLGVEYRTTERYKGKPVYVKAVDCGTITNNKAVTLVDEPYRLISGTVRAGSSPLPYFHNGRIEAGTSEEYSAWYNLEATRIVFFGGSQASTFGNVVATIKYI